MAKKVVIVGAGVAGLTIGDKLTEKGFDVTIVERDDAVGGLSRTYTDKDGFAFDSGPHRFYTKNERVINYIENVLKEDRYVSFKMGSAVYLLRKYYDWPLNLKTVRKLPFTFMVRAGIDMIALMFKRPKYEERFSDHILQKYGKTLYELDFDPYTSKFCKYPTTEVHSDWAKAGVNRAVIDGEMQMDSIYQVVKSTITNSMKKESLTLIYPNKGISVFSEIIQKRIESRNGRIILNTKVASIDVQDKQVKSVTLTDGTVIDDVDHIVWTGSINEIATLLDLPEKDLEYLNIITYNVRMKGQPKRKEQWIYYADADLIFNRLYNTVLFSPEKAPEGTYGLCAEVTTRNGSDIMEDPTIIYDRVLEDLKKVKLIDSDEEVIGIDHQVLFQAYPIYRVNYRGELRKAIDDITSVTDNLTLAGRNGLFWYNNMDHSIDNALNVAEAIANGERHIEIDEFWK